MTGMRGMRGGALAMVACAMTAGCGWGGFRTAEVTGTVTIDGVPRDGLLVQFAPDDGQQTNLPPGFGYTNAEGKYRVFRPGSRSGAVVGRHNVQVLTMEGGELLVGKKPLPGTTMVRDIVPGPNTIDIDIKTR